MIGMQVRDEDAIEMRRRQCRDAVVTRSQCGAAHDPGARVDQVR